MKKKALAKVNKMTSDYDSSLSFVPKLKHITLGCNKISILSEVLNSHLGFYFHF